MKKIIAIVLISLFLLSSFVTIYISAFDVEQEREFTPELITIDRYGTYISVIVYINDKGDILAPANILSMCGGMKLESSKDEYIYYYGDSRSDLRKEICIDKDGTHASSIVYRPNASYKIQKSVDFSDSYENNNILYLPLIEILPFIDGTIEITEDDGVLHIYPNPVSIFSALTYGPYDNLGSILYDVDNFWWDTFPGAAGYLIDTIMNWRYDRLDIVTNSGEIKDYTKIFKKLLTDNETYLSAFDKEKNPIQNSLDNMSGPLGDFSDNVGNVVDATDACAKRLKYMLGSEKYENYEEFIIEMEGLDYAGKMIDGFDKTISYFNAYANQVDDHREMLNAVYGGENYKDTPVCNAANEVALLYGTNTAGQVVAMTSSALRDYLSKVVSGAITSTVFKPYAIAFDVIKFVFSEENEYVGETAMIFKIENIIDDSSSVFNKNLEELELTEKSLNNTRLSLMMALTTSKYAYGTFRASIWEEDEIALKSELINNWLEKLYLAKDSIKCNTSEYYDKMKAELSEDLKYLKSGEELNPDTPYGSEGLEFTLNDDGLSYSVTGIGTCTDTTILIPGRYDGKLVTNIGDNAFRNNKSIVSVIIPDSIISIGKCAFARSSLISISIPDSVTTLGGGTFYGCSSLQSVNLGNGINNIATGYDYYTNSSGYHFAYGMFEECTSLTSIVIPNSVTSIGDSAFSGCSALTSVTIGDSVTSIGYGAFQYCDSLTNVNIPNSVTSIGSEAFESCTSLTSITIPDSVTSIGDSAFSGCSALTSVTIGDSVTSIGDDAFYKCTSLTSIVIPNSVTSIGVSAFFKCTSLKSVVIPDSVTSLGGGAFYGCSSLTNVKLGNGITRIDCYLYTFSHPNTEYGMFENCTSLINIDIPDSVTIIDNDAFRNCTSLESVKFGNSVESIEWCAFAGCDSLIKIDIPDSVTYIGPAAFSGCDSLTSVTIGDSVTSIGGQAFLDCTSLLNVTIGNSVERIGSIAFGDCYSLTSINFKGTVEQWNSIDTDSAWNNGTGTFTVYCTNGAISK